MFGIDGGGGAYDVRSDEDRLCEGPDWMAACAGLGEEFWNQYMDAVTLLAMERSPRAHEVRKLLARLRHDEIALRVVATNASTGDVPAWWPDRLPHIRIELREARAPEADPVRIFADPNRPGLGGELAWSRVKLWLLARPVPYAGRITMQIKGPDIGGNLAQLGVWFEVDTAAHPGDPAVRDALVSSERQAKRALRELQDKMLQERHKDREMRRMQGQVSDVVLSAADAMRAAQGLPPAPEKPEGPGFIQQLAVASLPVLQEIAKQVLPSQLPRVMHRVRQEVGPEIVDQLAREIVSKLEPQVILFSVHRARELLGEEGLREALAALGLNIDFGAVPEGRSDVEQGGSRAPSSPGAAVPEPRDGAPLGDEAETTHDSNLGDATCEWVEEIYRGLQAAREE
jgi:hypothetical protein